MQFARLVSILFLSFVISLNANASSNTSCNGGNGFCVNGGELRTYLYNWAPDTILVATSTGQNAVNISTSPWAFDKSRVGNAGLIEMHSVLELTQRTSQPYLDTSISHSVHISIIRGEHEVGICDFTYEYKGPVHEPDRFNNQKHWEIPVLHLKTSRCTDHFNIATRGSLFNPNTLVLSGTGSSCPVECDKWLKMEEDAKRHQEENRHHN